MSRLEVCPWDWTNWAPPFGSCCTAIDISDDDRSLIASTYAGFVVILDLDTGEADP
jgi:hypothetical protein